MASALVARPLGVCRKRGLVEVVTARRSCIVVGEHPPGGRTAAANSCDAGTPGGIYRVNMTDLPSRPLDPAELLAQRAWMRRFAAALAGAEGEDLVQEAWAYSSLLDEPLQLYHAALRARGRRDEAPR